MIAHKISKQGSACFGDEHQEPFGRTRTIKNAPNPIWNEEFDIDTVVGKETKLVVAVLDDDKGDDDMVGKVMVSLNNHPLGQEVDRWYHLNPLPGGRAAAAMRSLFRMNHDPPMLRIKSKFTAHAPEVEEGESSEVPFMRASSGAEVDRSARLPVITRGRSSLKQGTGTQSTQEAPSEIEWLRSKLGSLSSRKNPNGTVAMAGLVVKILRGHGWGVKGGGCKVMVNVDGKELGTHVVDVQEWGQDIVFEEELRYEDYVTGGFKVKAMTSGMVGKKVWNCAGEADVDESLLVMLSDTGKEWTVKLNDDSSIVLTCATRPRDGNEADPNTVRSENSHPLPTNLVPCQRIPTPFATDSRKTPSISHLDSWPLNHFFMTLPDRCAKVLNITRLDFAETGRIDGGIAK